MRILVTDGMDKTAMAQLRELGHEVVEQFYEPDQLGKALRDFDVAVVRSKTKVRANHIDEAKGGKLKLIIRGGVGVDNIDVKYAEANGITVKNTPKASSQSVAELAMGHMFSCARYLSIAGHTMREGKWEKKSYGKGIELQGKTLGIVGFGRIGQHLGVMAKAIGMKVVAFDIFHIPGIEEQLGIPYHDCRSVGTIIHMAVDGRYAGHIVISDVVKPHAKDAIAALHRAGVEKTVMLTGDVKKVADAVASELGVDEVHSDLLPADKVGKVEELLRQQHGKLAFVGDGINDAPVLGRADIGIAMGAMGSDAAIEAADIVLMDDEPMQIAKAIRISRKCIGIVYQNIVFALVVKFACLVLVAVGLANMWAAIFADVGVMVLAVLNAIRALRVHRL